MCRHPKLGIHNLSHCNENGENMINIASTVGKQINAYSNLFLTPSSNIFADTNIPSQATNKSDGGFTNNDSFTQSVLQSLQNLGLNVLDNSEPSTKSKALQTFIKNLQNALTQKMPPDNNVNIISVTNDIDTATNPLIISGGTSFKYSVDFSEADLGDYLPDVQANIKTALENIGQYIRSDAVFHVKVLPISSNENILAQANASVIPTKNNPNNDNADTTFIADSVRGSDLNSDTNDSTLYINVKKLDQMSFNGVPTPDKYDLTSILTHEILHGLAFTGLVDSTTHKEFKTAYDGLIATQEDGSPIFVGRHAKTANGGNPVPLSSKDSGTGSAYYHVAIPDDLMSPSIKKNEVKTISNLDIAMLQDMGISVTGALPPQTNLKMQNAYSDSSNPLQNSIDTLSNHAAKNTILQMDFSNLLHSLGNESSVVTLQDFFSELTKNNQDLLPNKTGFIFSATA